ncbi:RNA-binding protein [Phenylobacterium soli]|uniref:Uncharacterized protein n=1 Tax=Phenylobacterium soli TaxID=2170551 RepID=A0A328AMP9_9CAUL|nr:hypothetical protein [Phenylobacterium soli]RAK55671.1 hypothetical protein DJ017_14710 [Phenylobacterium soli]
MILNPFKLKAGLALSEEADDLEARFGPAGAVRHVRDQIALSRRSARQHLYRLHDEIVRRHPSVSPA